MKTIRRWLSLPFEILAVLRSIESRLARVEAETERLGRCISNHNHRHRYSLTTGHWNDPSR